MNPELESYVESHSSPQSPLLADIERRANIRLLNGRMCSGFLQGRLLKMIASMVKPRRVLELGTFAGYSALCIAEALTEGASVDTIEIDDELEDFILDNFRRSDYADKIRLHIGDAADVATQWLPETFDLIFLDADKRRYCEDFELVFPLLRKGGFLLADNTLWGGNVIDPQKQHDRQTLGICRFNDMLAARDDVETLILPLRDGLSIVRKK